MSPLLAPGTLGVIAGMTISANCLAGVTLFQGDANGWLQAVATHETIGFTEYPHNTLIGEQYSNLGVHFTDTDGNWIIANASASYPQDGCGLNGNQFVELSFDQPMSAFAIYFPGVEFFTCFLGEREVFRSSMLGIGGPNNFAGITSDTPFDRVVLHSLPPDHFGIIHKVFLDDIYFSDVPGPSGAIVIVGLAALAQRGRRGHG